MPSKPKYRFNKETLSFEKIEIGFLHILKRIGSYTIVGIAIGIASFFVISHFFASPTEKFLRQENEEIISQYKLLSKQIDEMYGVIEDLRERDNNLYRAILQTEPIDNKEDASMYRQYENMSNMDFIKYVSKKSDDIAKQIYIQSKSYDDIFVLFNQNEKKLQHVPAIQPVMNKNLKRLASGYGYRRDPVYNTTRFHYGMDFAAPTGTDIFATGNGTISYSGWKRGFGNCIIINHGFNYETLYAHMSKLIAKEGQKVVRGEVIGLVGNTGKSTGPHLHYEVHFKGKPQDPRNYYFLDLSPEQYDEMIRLSENSGKILD